MTLYANPKYFATWATSGNGKGNGKSRHDYECTEHTLSDMQTEDYWGTLAEQLAPGDLIWVKDAAIEQMVVSIDWVDARLRRVGFSVQERIVERAIVGSDGLAIKYRGGRGGLWCVLDADGEILSRDHRTRVEAERQRDALKLSKVA
jgi:hypothetical protein